MAHGWSPEFFTQNLLCLSRFPGHGWTCCQDEESWNFLLFLPPYPIYVLSWTLLSWDSENTVSSLSSGRAGVGSEQLGCQCLAHQRHTMKICEFCKVEFFVLIHLVDWPDVEDIPVLLFFLFFFFFQNTTWAPKWLHQWSGSSEFSFCWFLYPVS